MAEILPDALSWLDAKKRQVIAELATGLSSGETFSDSVLAAARDLARNLTGGALFPTPEQRQAVEDRQSVMPEVAQPAIRDAVASAAGGFGVGPLGVGALRAAGRADLMPSHGTSMESLISNGKMIPELYSPSIAIQKDTLANPFSVNKFSLIPKLGAFDPQYTLNAQLFNRDAYIARKRDYQGTPSNYSIGVENKTLAEVKAIALARNWDRFEANPPAGSEGRGWYDWPQIKSAGMHDITQQAAVDSAPNFRSFASFEKSPAGAETLGNTYNEVSGWSKEFTSRLRNLLGQAGILDEGGIGQLPQWRSLSQNFLMFLKDPQLASETQRIMASAQRAPSEYAELKVSGAAPLTSDLWAGALWDPSTASPGLSRIFQSEMAKRGLAIHPIDSNISPLESFRAADLLQKFASPAKSGSTAGWEGLMRGVAPPEIAMPQESLTGRGIPKQAGTGSFLVQNPSGGLEIGVKYPGGDNSIHDSFSKAASDAWSPKGNKVFTHSGEGYIVMPDGVIYNDTSKPAIGTLDVAGAGLWPEAPQNFNTIQEAAKAAIKKGPEEGSSFVDFSFKGKDYWAAPESGNVFTFDTHQFVVQAK